ncbi:hypothetical protein [Chitinophaga rhizophila]|uniref:Uncharacterized protein n=1 Tax=Chitinophaga rhizophila TaxID=2866212 RepID=A0ABS7G6R8_9BACT|nr:hypothetical protein [Chitinophaga rhizophila]MBW8683352.1 hypothetical protein [Chitinophaga rhizophila]
MESATIPNKGINWAYIFSPCMILIIVTSITFIIHAFGEQQGITELLLLALCLPILMTAVVVDILLKVAFSEAANKGKMLWIIQPAVIITILLSILLADI